MHTIGKVLVANRGEIAVQVMRAAWELGLSTVGVYTAEDHAAAHRIESDESHELGEPGHPVGGYLDVDALVTTALAAGADAVHPGYGFLSESAVLADACAAAGFTFVGPPASVLLLTATWSAPNQRGKVRCGPTPPTHQYRGGPAWSGLAEGKHRRRRQQGPGALCG